MRLNNEHAKVKLLRNKIKHWRVLFLFNPLFYPPFPTPNHLAMKSRFFLIIILLTAVFVGSTKLKAQNTAQIKSSLQSGNATALSQHFADNLDITLPNDDNNYSRSEALQRMTTFFQQYSPTNFAVKHEGTAPNGSKFMIGTLNTSSGSFRTSIVIRQNQIQELSIEK